MSIASVMFLFGLTWLFGALTVTGFGDSKASTAFQVLFVILNAFQGFFIFLFFCVFSKDARDSWLELLSCGHYQSKSLHRSQTRYASSRSNSIRKVKTTNTTNSNFTSARSEHNTSIKETTAADKEKENLSFKESYEADISMDKKVDLKPPKMEKYPGESCVDIDTKC